MTKPQIANWHNLRVQRNGVVFLRNTNKLATERVNDDVRYVRVTPESSKPFTTKVSKLVYALFGEIEVNTLSKIWNVEHYDGNTMNCDIDNLKFVEHHSSKIPEDIRMNILREYKKGVRGSGMTALAIKYGLMPQQVSYVVKHPRPMELHRLKKEK